MREARDAVRATRGKTYADNSWVIRHGRRLVLLLGAGGLFDAEILDIATTEYNVLVDLFGGGYLLLGPAFAAFRAKGHDIFERNSGILRVDLMKGADISLRSN